jgi:hypothetical protein
VVWTGFGCGACGLGLKGLEFRDVMHVVMCCICNGQLEMSNEEAYAHMQQLIIQSQNAFIPQMVCLDYFSLHV